jgi:hypothetical protein
MLLSPRVREGVHGVHVVTPLVRENGSTILVDRGFVSNDFVSSINSEEEMGEVEVLGMLRTSQPRNTFTPNNEPEKGLWYWTDVDKMAEYAGGEPANVQPVFVEQIFGELSTSHEFNALKKYLQRAMLEKPIPNCRKEYPSAAPLQSIFGIRICHMSLLGEFRTAYLRLILIAGFSGIHYPHSLQSCFCASLQTRGSLLDVGCRVLSKLLLSVSENSG